MGLETTVKRHKLLTAYLAFGPVYAYMPGQQANQVATGASQTNVWGGFGSQNSRINSLIQNALFWPYAIASGNAQANDNNNSSQDGMLGAGQTWTSNGAATNASN
jgi:hypothetical protein